MALSCYQVLLAFGMLVTGSINTISKKAQNDVVVEGLPVNGTATPHSFDHPWFQTVIMFIGETICLFGLCFQRKRERDKYLKEQEQKVIQGDFNTGLPLQQPRIFQIIFAIPTVCDLIGTSLAGIGLLYVDGSVWQMLRGSIIIFAGILSKIFLKRKLRCIHWSGMIVTVLGLVLVGLSSVLKNQKEEDSKAILGIIFILAGQVVSASQMIIEELFLKKRNFQPLQVVGMEGSFGVFFMVCAVLPAMYFIPGPQVGNSYENSIDALYQIYNSPRLLIFCLLYLASIAFYNYFGLAVTKSLTAVHRTLIDALRTIMVWVVDLLIYYLFDKDFGEEFDKTYGLLQVDGFLFLLIGTALYNELVEVQCIPCLRKPSQEMEEITPKNPRHIQDAAKIDETSPLLEET
ncbi:solute carrier family 35 member F6 [Lingula anatina]|uniref:Solute carrier family 35 member F6 n=1 Tax=Lingula anatina TaxID=7574 RepID=A0A1S3J898_LINAN|nr:solute carrier family 35 member F6 [Lingula anatina]|eukprot:XP_023930700.1 solute carrier family 35 member F6 [Lingula anatina]